MTERAEADTVAYTVENRIAWVSFNRPEKRNCMGPKLNRQIRRVLDELEFRDDVGVVVLIGEGSAWSAGVDLKECFRENEEKGLGAIRKAQREAYGWWVRLAGAKSRLSPRSTASASAALTARCSAVTLQWRQKTRSSGSARSTGGSCLVEARARSSSSSRASAM